MELPSSNDEPTNVLAHPAELLGLCEYLVNNGDLDRNDRLQAS